MGTRPVHVGAQAGTTDLAQLQQAVDTARGLQAGQSVAPGQVSGARETLIDTLWNEDPTVNHVARQGLGILYDCSIAAEDRAELVGELVAAGPRGRPVLDDLGRRKGELPLSEAEFVGLQGDLELPPAGRLASIAAMLQRETPAEAPSPVMPDGSQDESGRKEFADRPQRLPVVRRAGRAVAAGDPQFGRLRDAAIPEPARLDAALQLGAKAVPALLELLGGDQNEFASVALVHLGRAPEARQAVADATTRLEFNPELRPTAEVVRASLQGSGTTASDDRGARLRTRQANIGDTWLLRALKSCDSPNIMQAAAGREVAVIPIALRELAAARVRRGWSESST